MALAAYNEAWRVWEASGMSEAALSDAERTSATLMLTYENISDAYEKRRIRFQA